MTKKQILLILFVLLNNLIISQIKIESLTNNQSKDLDKILFGSSDTRSVFTINDSWKAYHESDSENKASINLPAYFEGTETIIIERGLELTAAQINNNQIKIGFLGLSYFAEISINKNIIYNHYGGSFPFEVPLPKDLLLSDRKNKISIKISHKYDSESTIPLKQQFLFPNFYGGVFRDVYVKILPKISISKISLTTPLNNSNSNAEIDLKIDIENQQQNRIAQPSNILLRVNLYTKGSSLPYAKGEYNYSISNEDTYTANCNLNVVNPLLWSPEQPNVYTCEVMLVKDGIVVDKKVRSLSILKLSQESKALFLNNSKFNLKGTTYILNETMHRNKNMFDKIREDLALIKQTGFNAVRFAKAYPHPFALQVCQELGLLALIELPINSFPEDLLDQNDFVLKAKGYLNLFISSYEQHSNSFMIGMGSSFLPNSEITQNFLTKLGSEAKKKSIFTYASFFGLQTSLITNIDLLGIEVYSNKKEDLQNSISNAAESIEFNNYFLSEVTYPNYLGSSTGYLVRNSNEAQAKYFEDIINMSSQLKISGFFINSLLPYEGKFSSLYSSNSKDNLYRFSVLGKNRNLSTIAYKVIYSKLNQGNKVTIPIGARKDPNPIFFIFTALILSVFMAILINTRKKFREYATRALIRPYIFFADIRDHRIMSGLHSALLMLIVSGSTALLFTIMLFYWRNDILFEKILLSFASTRLMKSVSYLAWNPEICFAVLFVLVAVKIFFVSLIVKFASFFVKTKVPFSNIYFSVVWALLPLTLFLPVELILYKILMMQSFNILIFLIVAFLLFWLILRLIKAIYIIFDVPAFMVYSISFVAILLVLGAFTLKYQLTHSIINQIGNSIKQYNSMTY